MASDSEFQPENSEQFERKLQAFLYRWDCPSPELLSDYRLNLVDAQDRASIEQHLQHCALCREELSAFEQLLADENAASENSTPLGMGDVSPARALPLLSTQLPARRIATRGEEAEPAKFVFEGDITVYLQVETKIDHYLLLGQMAVSQEHVKTWTEALVEVWHGATLVATAAVDADNAFRCKLKALDLYSVRIIAHDGSMLVCSIEP